MACLLAGCGKSPGPQYRFSAAQLAWQAYHPGDVLRFGHDQDSRVRTYRVTKVTDEMENRPGFYLSFDSEPPKYQHISVEMKRTDTTVTYFRALDMDVPPETGAPARPDSTWCQASAEWENSWMQLPIDAVERGRRIDTLVYGPNELLPTATFGPSTYTGVIHSTVRHPYGSPTGTPRRPSHFYYARNKGVVAFEEDGTGLWYRLP